MRRINQDHVSAKIDILNRLLGFENAKHSTIGSIQLYGDQSGWKLHLIMNEYGGVTSVTETGTLRETAAAVQGMIAATRIARGERP